MGGYQGASFTQVYNTSNAKSYSRMNVEGWVGNRGVFAGGSFLNVRDLDTGFESIGRQPGTNYQQFAGDIKLNYFTARNALLTLSLQHLEQEDLPRSDRFPGFPGDLNNSNSAGGARFFDPQQRDLAYARYQMLYPNEAIDVLTATVSYHRQREAQTRGMPVTTRAQEIDVETFGLNLVAAKQLGPAFGKLTYGVDLYHDEVDSPFSGSAPGPIIPDDASYTRAGVFANWEVPLTDRLNAVAGGRFEYIELEATPVLDINTNPTPVFIEPNFDDLVGHIGLNYEVNQCLRLVGSISEGFRAPNLDELTANNPNVLQQGMDLPSLGLAPEHSVTYEVGAKTDFDRLRTQTFVFWTDLDNNIVPVTAGANQFTRDNQDSYIQGVEFDGELLLDRGWSLYGNFWYIYGKNELTGAPLSRIPPTQGILGLRWRGAESHNYFTVYTWMVDRQDRLDPVRDLSDERIPPGGTPGYATLNIRAGRTLGCYDQHRLSLSLENITDQPYLVHGSGVFGTGFTAQLGYTWDY
jgi:hemoglobin/transferrin/lactoferrin receptor protein